MFSQESFVVKDDDEIGPKRRSRTVQPLLFFMNCCNLSFLSYTVGSLFAKKLDTLQHTLQK